ncbi:glycine zipper 2TM domain-containing protein [Silvimonas sp. JCM 19000]
MSDQKLHPVIWVTAGAVILACAAAVAHFAGWMGGPKTEDTNAALVASQPAVALVTPLPQVAEASAPVTPTAQPVAAATPAPAPVKTASTKHHSQRATGRNEGTEYANNNAPTQNAPVCANCGRVTSVEAVQHEGSGSGVGAVGGGVVGGLVGNQIGNGRGRTLATVAGALGGALAGNTVEKHVRTTTDYVVHVAFDDGSSRSFSYKEKPGFTSGERVRANGDTLSAD